MPSKSLRRKAKNGYHKSSTDHNATLNIKMTVTQEKHSSNSKQTNTTTHTTTTNGPHRSKSSASSTRTGGSSKQHSSSSHTTSTTTTDISRTDMSLSLSTSSSSLRRERSRHKKKRKKRKHRDTATWCGSWSICITFSVSFVLLSFECYLTFGQIGSDNKPPFLSDTIYNEDEAKYSAIDPNVLYDWNYDEIYQFRDEMALIFLPLNAPPDRFHAPILMDDEGDTIKDESNEEEAEGEGAAPAPGRYTDGYRYEYEYVYSQNLAEGYIDEDHITNIHSDEYFNAYQEMKRKDSNGDIVDGYVLNADTNGEYFLVFYRYIFSEYPLVYMILKNILGFLLIILSILSPSTSRKLYILIFGVSSMMNCLLAFKNPNIYLSFTKTAIPIYKRLIYEYYAANPSQILLVIAFIQHVIASVLYLKNIKKTKRKRKKSSKDKYNISCLYCLCLVIGALNFILLIPAGVDWNQYGVIKFSSSSVSFAVGLILLLLNHFGFLIDQKHKKDKKKQLKLKSKQLKGTAAGAESDKNNNNSEVDGTQKQKDDKKESDGDKKKTEEEKEKEKENKNKDLRLLLKAKIDAKREKRLRGDKKTKISKKQKKRNERIKEKEKEKQITESLSTHINNIKESKQNKIKNTNHDANKEEENDKKENGKEDKEKEMHRKKVKLKDGTTIKCQCNDCKDRRQRRRNDRKRFKLVNKMKRK